MNFKKGESVSGKVIAVENHGITLEIDDGVKGFLPKEAMHISKNKKLTDIFSLDYIIKANVVNKKADYYTLTQKTVINTVINKETQKNKAPKKEDNIKEQKTKPKKKKEVKKEQKIKETKVKATDKEEELVNNPTLKDLKKLKAIGNLKISVKKSNRLYDETQTYQSEKEEKVYLEVPENFVDNMIDKFKDNSDRFDKLKARLLERGLIDEN
ncbi:S1 RNA-binding domain-containing protein [Gemelliphila palaticanis]|uniref:RNA-binding protein n=1 Tax=Gemelliphila palaticanis TaxID=81950 RepID=A0ABX2SYC5_9BACL|nr:S1 RNA-binding domain-containing protein [Gemella palaticanis]MBF0715385.1 RNA-binding protein [Gemella palaticanis]NYS47315.1 RNA-binding protein [Gemella palaticanis]